MTTTAPKTRSRLSSDKEFLKKLVTILEKDQLTKEQLAVALGLENGKKISDSILLAAVKFAGNSSFLSNIIEKKGGPARKGIEYSAKKGLIIPAYMFEGKNVADGQKYEMNYGVRTGIVTLKPVDE
ncbi:MAG: hypothetical protein KJ630_05620 [Proteobacteria bacterium]|nr:hypothetical protein [Pseudomonadota bacterium]